VVFSDSSKATLTLIGKFSGAPNVTLDGARTMPSACAAKLVANTMGATTMMLRAFMQRSPSRRIDASSSKYRAGL
jgi:hypothetical protein